MINDIKEYFRYRLYNNCNILVNNLNDVISEVSMFLDNKVYKFLEDNDDCKGIFVYGILIELKDNKIVEKESKINKRPKPNKNTLSKVKNPAMLLNKKRKSDIRRYRIFP